MSACNLILQGSRGYLMTDAAYTNEDGTLAVIRSKVLTIPRFSMALSSRGSVWTTDLQREIAVADDASPEALIDRLPGMLMAMKAIDRIAYPADDSWAAIVYVVYFCQRRRRPAGFIIADDNADMPASYEPYTLASVASCFGPGVDEAAVLSKDVDPCGPDFDIERDGLAIMEAQRQQPLASIGGFAQLTTVCRAGVSTRTIHRWNDREGQAVNR